VLPPSPREQQRDQERAEHRKEDHQGEEMDSTKLISAPHQEDVKQSGDPERSHRGVPLHVAFWNLRAMAEAQAIRAGMPLTNSRR